MKAELRKKDCFDVTMGIPSLTIELEGCQRMIPWHSFAGGKMDDRGIEMSFTDWRLTIKGRSLSILWELLQSQDARVIRVVPEEVHQPGDCLVDSIQLEACED